MIGFSTINDVIQELLKKKLVSKVFHSVEIWDHNAERFPAYRDGDEFVYIGVDDTKNMSAYIREISGFSVDGNGSTFIAAGGKKMYRGKIGYRIVFFNDFEDRNHDDILVSLLHFTFFPAIYLAKIINNTEELLRLEAKPNNFHFGATTFYKAFDFSVSVSFEANRCDQVIGCGNWANPITLPN